MSTSGYCDCDCATCFEIAIGDENESPVFCNSCEEAGCDGDGECQVECDHETQNVNDRSQFVCLDCGEELGR